MLRDFKLRGGGGSNFWENHVNTATIGLKKELRSLTSFKFYDVFSKYPKDINSKIH